MLLIFHKTMTKIMSYIKSFNNKYVCFLWKNSTTLLWNYYTPCIKLIISKRCLILIVIITFNNLINLFDIFSFRLLKRAMDSLSGIPLQDGSDVFLYVAENFYGRDIVYDFFKKHMDEISFR